jgi:hypothetical protein
MKLSAQAIEDEHVPEFSDEFAHFRFAWFEDVECLLHEASGFLPDFIPISPYPRNPYATRGECTFFGGLFEESDADEWLFDQNPRNLTREDMEAEEDYANYINAKYPRWWNLFQEHDEDEDEDEDEDGTYYQYPGNLNQFETCLEKLNLQTCFFAEASRALPRAAMRDPRLVAALLSSRMFDVNARSRDSYNPMYPGLRRPGASTALTDLIADDGSGLDVMLVLMRDPSFDPQRHSWTDPRTGRTKPLAILLVEYGSYGLAPVMRELIDVHGIDVHSDNALLALCNGPREHECFESHTSPQPDLEMLALLLEQPGVCRIDLAHRSSLRYILDNYPFEPEVKIYVPSAAADAIECVAAVRIQRAVRAFLEDRARERAVKRFVLDHWRFRPRGAGARTCIRNMYQSASGIDRQSVAL